MPNNKNQHYVPQFYLRNFAADPQRRRICVFNVGQEKCIVGASIKGQCSRDNWHGKSNAILEESVRRVEGRTATEFRDCIRDKKLPDFRSLAIYLAIQLGRTQSSAETQAEAHDKLHKSIYGEPQKDQSLKPLRSIASHLAHWPLLLDMGACLVINETDIDFITSDHPVALSNWWYHKSHRKNPGPGTGFAQAGLEICFPISPKNHIVLYDRNIWEIPKANSNRTLVLRKSQDVIALNERQMLNARSNVYFADINSAPQVEQLYANCSDCRPRGYVNIYEFVPSKHEAGKFVPSGSEEAVKKIREKMVVSEPTHFEPTRLKSMRKRPKARYDDDGSAMGPLRDEAWVSIFLEFRNRLKAQQIQLHDIDQFAMGHPAFERVRPWKNKRLRID